jgi:hypothetical protein
MSWVSDTRGGPSSRVVGLCFGGLASIDLAARIVPELLGLGDSLLLPVGALLATTYALELATVGWLFGWLLFGMVVFQMSPLLFPRRLHEWAHGLPNRVALTASAVGVGVFIEQSILVGLQVGRSPLPVALERFPLVAGAAVVLLLLSRFVPPVRWESGLLYSFDRSIYPREEARSGIFTTQHLLVVLLLGVLLAETSLLFPLPELLILAVVGSDLVGRPLTGSVPARRDVTERLVQGVAGLWIGPRGLLWFFYSSFGLFAVFFFLVLYVDYLDFWALLASRPRTGAFLAYCFGGMAVLVIVASVRLLERIPAQIHTRQRRGGLATRTSEATPPAGDRSRVPGLLIPAGVLWVVLEFARPTFENGTPAAEIPAFTITPTLVGVAAVTSLLGVLTVVRSGWFPELPLSDYQAAALSMACLFTLGIGVGFSTGSTEPTGGSMRLHVLSSSVAVFGTAMGPYVGYELAPAEDSAAPGLELLKGLIWQGVLFFLLGSLVVIAALAVLGTNPTESNTVAAGAFNVVLVLVSVPLLVGAVTRAVLLLFYGGDLVPFAGSS